MSHLEIEKRYLCNGSKIIDILKKNHINYIILNLEQFYLKATKIETLRYRKDGCRYFKNIKKGRGLVREEIEEEISKKEYKKAKEKNSGGVIKKERYKFILDGNLYELDIFKGKLKGLSILEIEFKDIYSANNFKVNQILAPAIIKDITNEMIYSNGALSRSMKIPLREDSKFSLNELSKEKLIKTKYDLYISEYENSKYALNNTIKRVYNSFKLNIEIFLKSKNIKSLKRLYRALMKLKSLILGHKKYISKESYIEILFNINSLLLIFENAINYHRSFMVLLKYKYKLPLNRQNDILKELIKIAQKEKKSIDYIFNFCQNRNFKDIESLLNNIEYKMEINCPFNYLKDRILKNELKKLKKCIKTYSIEELYLKILNFRNLYKYFHKHTIFKKEFKKIRYTYFYSNCLNMVTSSFKIECKNDISTKKISKKLKRKLIAN